MILLAFYMMILYSLLNLPYIIKKNNMMMLFIIMYLFMYTYYMYFNFNYMSLLKMSWIFIYNIIANFNIIISKLNIYMFYLMFIISIYILLYSIMYLKNDININKFLAFIMLFTLSMLLCILSSNWILFFIGWEFLGITSFLLINYWDTRIEANKSGLKALFLNKLGDISLLLSMMSLWYMFKSYIFIMQMLLINYINFKFFLMYMLMLMLFAVFMKSVQFMLNMWILDAMEGPTPVSAFLHSATMVVLGIYLLFKISYLFVMMNNMFMMVMTLMSIMTIFFSSFNGMYAYDIKSMLASSTSGQIGYMFLAMANFYNWLFLFHFIMHAFFKSMLFLLCGLISHMSKDNQDLRKMKLLYKQNPVMYTMLLMNILALMGLPSFMSNYSKEFIMVSYMNLFNMFMYILLLISIILTLMYSLKLILIFFNYTFFKKEKLFYKYKEFPYFLLLIINIPIVLFWLSFYIKFNYLLSNMNIENYYYLNNNMNFYFYKNCFFNMSPLFIIVTYLMFFNIMTMDNEMISNNKMMKYSILNFYNDSIYNYMNKFLIKNFLKYQTMLSKFLMFLSKL